MLRGGDLRQLCQEQSTAYEATGRAGRDHDFHVTGTHSVGEFSTIFACT